MTVEYRSARPEELPRFIYTDQVGFGNSTAEDVLRDRVERVMDIPFLTLCAFEDGEPVSQVGTYPLTMRWNGRDIGCGGVTAVSTLPSHRRRGHLRELMTRSFATMRDSGQPVAMLWASMAAIYQRFGYGIAFTRWMYEFNPRDLLYVEEVPVPGRVRLVQATAAPPVISAAYDCFAAPRTTMLQRPPAIWEKGVLRPWDPKMAPFLVAVYEEGDTVLGYTIYTVDRKGGLMVGPPLVVAARELVWQTPAAHRALVQFLCGYDLAATVQILQLPVDDPLFYQAQEPRGLGARALDGTLVRIVDLQPALEGRGYDGEGCFSFSLADDLCPWNGGTWEMSVEGGHARLRRTDAEAALCVTPRALAMLAAGYMPATTLARLDLIAGGDAAVLATADRIFHTTHAAACLDFF